VKKRKQQAAEGAAPAATKKSAKKGSKRDAAAGGQPQEPEVDRGVVSKFEFHSYFLLICVCHEREAQHAELDGWPAAARTPSCFPILITAHSQLCGETVLTCSYSESS